MIASLHGIVREKFDTSYILEVGGIGYEIFPTAQEYFTLEAGQAVTVYIAESIKEDSYTLFGFSQLPARQAYFRLTSVSGVGPKAAMSILSKHSVEEVDTAIAQGNITLFSDVSGIGKKTAQRIILELKGKLVSAPNKKDLSADPAYQALLSLGFSAAQAGAAIKDLPTELGLDEKVRRALKEIGR